jgi:5-hydroxyisourate hydrolase
MGKLTTHILDTANGCPGKGISICLYDSNNNLLKKTITNDDGRCDEPLLEDESFKEGSYRLEFSVADYYKNRGIELPNTPFLDVVSINFGVADKDEHYHVPLLVSPYGYSTYRGS